MKKTILATIHLLFLYFSLLAQSPRERIRINEGWRFFRYATAAEADSLYYDIRPKEISDKDDKPADSRPTEGARVNGQTNGLKPWIMPSGNRFIADPAKRYSRPTGHPGSDFPFVQAGFNDGAWEKVNLPHDWAIKGPFYKGWDTEIGGGMGRLPVQGVAWYRRKLDIPASDKGKRIFLEIEGAMSYAIVWLNGRLVGGWPYGYNSWQLDLTPYITPGGENQLAIRLDNPPASARWYPGGGIYRDVWLTKLQPVHIAQWGSFITTPHVSALSATVQIELEVDNEASVATEVSVVSEIYMLDQAGRKSGKPVAVLRSGKERIRPGASRVIKGSMEIKQPRLWGPPPTQSPDRYVAVSKLLLGRKVSDVYETPFGIRSLTFDPVKGLLVNGENIRINGVNQHHDLGALGAAFNRRAAERQLEMLKEMGCNAIRMSHNPPAPELLAMTDSMGFLVVNEVFDSWQLKKTPLDFHLVFNDWHEQDLRAMIRRDRNHPSVIIWSFGNEVGEQYTGHEGAALARQLYTIVKQEDTTRPATVAMNYAKPHMPLPAELDVISLNYQGEGIRYDGAYKGLQGIITPPQFPLFHERFPGKMIMSSENASALSSRGEYMFPVFPGNSAPVNDSMGGNSITQQVSSYELHSVNFGASADKVFASLDKHPFVAGGFVWTGWDYIGEPTPYYLSRSSYCGIIDLAGFKKDRFFLYQSYWRPEQPVAHILPHWNWPGREGMVTPVHVFTSGDEAELFLDGRSLGRKKKEPFTYRLRWDDVTYTPGTLTVVAYKNGKRWAEDTVHTTGAASALRLEADRSAIRADGEDLCFITVRVTDHKGNTVPDAKHLLRFSIEGDGEIIATDNGDASDLVPFASLEKNAFNGLCLVVVRAKHGGRNGFTVKAESNGMEPGNIVVRSL